MGILDLEGDLLPPDMTTDYIRDFGGLIETFVSLNDDARIPLQEIPFDLYTLNGVSGKGEQQAYEAYARIAVGAHVLIATHAALVRDMSFSGRLLDHEGIGFSMIVCDEANHLENAGVLALGTKRALSSFRRDIQIVTPFLDKVSDRIRIDVTARLLELNAEGERMLALLQAIRDAADNARHEIVVEGNEAWLTILRDLHERSTQIVDTLKTSPNADIKAVATRLSNRNRDVGVFLDCIRRRETAALIGRAARLDPQDVPYAVPLLTFSPHAHEPSVLARPKKGSRILSRLWSQETPRADAVFLTSATLGMPARAGGASHTTILENVGIEPTSPRINFDLAQSVEMTKFGTLKALMLAGPNTPTPSLPKGQRRDGNHRNPDWLRFVAERIHEALQDVWRSDLKNRVAVLCTSFDEAAAIGELCDELVGPGKLYVRRRHDAVDDGFDWLAQQKTGVLVTTGAFDGIDRPGLIDHLVVPRLPFPSRPGGLYKQFTDATGELRYSRRTEEMLMALKQAFGRPFRKQTDAAKIWVLDPRIGLPAETNMIAHPLSDNRYLNAVPMRFRHIVENAVILARNPGEIER
jgi:ATP-dependent DNA helicase DinG